MATDGQRPTNALPNCVCVRCGLAFHRKPSHVQHVQHVYCSWACRFPGDRIEQFWAKVNKNGPIPAHCPELGPCWVWTSGTAGTNGYGKFNVERRQWFVHRFAWELVHGPIPDGLHVCHRCDNPACLRVEHLVLGTRSFNIRDSVTKGRHGSSTHPERIPRGDSHGSRTRPERRPRGEDSPHARLTEADVREIRRVYEAGDTSFRVLGLRFGVDKTAIGGIITGHTWRHVR